MNFAKRISIVFLSLILAASAFAVDFGGSVDNNTKLGTSDFDSWSLTQQNSLTAWLKVPFNSDGSLYLATEGTLAYSLYVPNLSDSKNTSNLMVDIDLLKLGGVFNIGDNLLQLNLGRFYLSDVTAIILSQTADGVQGVFTANTFKASLYAAYTGFTNAQFGTMNDGVTSTYVPDYKKVYCWNSPYIITGATISAPYLFANQTLGAEVYGVFGTGGLRGSNSGYNRGYFTVFLNGPLAKNLYYTFTSTLGINDGISNLTTATVSYYPDFLSSALSLNATYASGEAGPFKAFQSFSSNIATYAYNSPEYTSLFKLGLRGSIKPIDSIYAVVGTDMVLDTGKESGFRGVQWDAGVKYQPFTDLQVSLTAKQFYDFKKESNNSTAFSLNASLSF
ncbi:MAG: hypothetical protein IKI90_06600 [Treponema sp.]|nr:hypothetical protein [Treponema sp.]